MDSECDSRNENGLKCTPDTDESTVKIRNINMGKCSIDSAKTECPLNVIYRNMSEKISSIVIEVLKKIDTDKKKKINLQNTRFSSVFPKASSSLLLYITILYIVFYLFFLLY